MVVVGLDIGYSNLKLAVGCCGEPPLERVMPAVVAPEAHVAERLAGVPSGTSDGLADGVRLSLHGQPWITGINPARVSGWQRVLHEDYAASESYQALVLAALQLVGEARIDHLVTGLPVAQASDPTPREQLRRRLQGRQRLNAGWVEIAEVRVIAQPVGAFVDLLMLADAALMGQLPTVGGAAITTRHCQLCASVFVMLYRHLQLASSGAGGQDRRSRSIVAMIQAHDQAQLVLGAENSLEITLCWMLARDLRMGRARLRSCPQCQIQYLVTEQGRFDQGCPLCARYRSLGLSSLKVGQAGGSLLRG